MKKLQINISIATIAIAIATLSQAQEIKSVEVKEIMERVADWQIDHFSELYSGRKKPHHRLGWQNGAFYVGLVKWAKMADDDKYYTWLKAVGEEHEWILHKRKYSNSPPANLNLSLRRIKLRLKSKTFNKKAYSIAEEK